VEEEKEDEDDGMPRMPGGKPPGAR
jgi:hypothetical protein